MFCPPLPTTKKLIQCIFICICILVLWLPGSSQTEHEIDSILQRINSRPGEDSIKAFDYFQVGVRYQDLNDYKLAEEYLTKSLRYSEKTGNKKGVAWCKDFIGQIYESKGNYPKALKLYNEGLELTLEIKDSLGAAHGYGNVGLIQWHLGQYSEAIQNHLMSLNMMDHLGNKLGMARAYSNLGEIYDDLGDYPKALENYIAALKIAEEKKFKLGIAISHGNIGQIYGYQKNFAAAIESFDSALKTYEEIGEKSGVADIHIRLGKVYAEQNDFQKALNHGSSAVQISTKIGYKSGIAAGYDLMGNAYMQLNDLHSALKNMLRGLDIWREMGEKQSLANAHNNIGALYLKLEKYHEARQHYKDALQIAKEIGAKSETQDAYFGLSQAGTALGEHQLALIDYHAYVTYKDSLLNEANNKDIARLKEQFDSEKKDQTIELLSKEKALQASDLKRQKQTQKYLLACLGLVIFLSYFMYRYYRTKQDMKVLMLRNKIASDLHDDVGSTLSSISIFSDMARSQSRDVIPALETIGESSRKMLDAMADIVWTINPENDEFEKIIMRMRSFAYELLGASGIDFEFHVDEDVSGIQVPMQVRKNIYLIFKEALNNLVKYAKTDTALLTMKRKDDMLTMMIRDHGNGFDISRKHLGNGLHNMKRRAEEIEAQLLIDSVPGLGTTVKLQLAI